MLKRNNKGFALVETLVTVVFVSALFSIVFLNFYPLLGEYEKRENYDDVTSKYGVFWIKRLVENSDFEVHMNDYGYQVINCETLYPTGSSEYKLCGKIFEMYGANSTGTILTNYTITNLKNRVNLYNGELFMHSGGLDDYITYLPKYDYVGNNHSDITDSDLYQKYRLIVSFTHHTNSGAGGIKRDSGSSYDYYTFATIGVNK